MHDSIELDSDDYSNENDQLSIIEEVAVNIEIDNLEAEETNQTSKAMTTNATRQSSTERFKQHLITGQRRFRLRKKCAE